MIYNLHAHTFDLLPRTATLRKKIPPSIYYHTPLDFENFNLSAEFLSFMYEFIHHNERILTNIHIYIHRAGNKGLTTLLSSYG